MSKAQKCFFIGDFSPFMYFANLAPFALAVIDGQYELGIEIHPLVESKLSDLLEFISTTDEKQHQYALNNFYEYHQLWTGMSFFIEFTHMNYMSGLRFSSSAEDRDRLIYLKSQAKSHLHNFLLSQKVE